MKCLFFKYDFMVSWDLVSEMRAAVDANSDHELWEEVTTVDGASWDVMWQVREFNEDNVPGVAEGFCIAINRSGWITLVWAIGESVLDIIEDQPIDLSGPYDLRRYVDNGSTIKEEIFRVDANGSKTKQRERDHGEDPMEWMVGYRISDTKKRIANDDFRKDSEDDDFILKLELEAVE